MDELTNIRLKIDSIDKKIAILLEERAAEVFNIKKVKKQKNIKVHNPDREEEVLQKLDSQYKKEIFKKIMEESRKLQQ